MQEVIVDGYNVIYADPSLRRSMLREPREAREALAELLSRYAQSRGVRVTIVFDGARNRSDVRAHVAGRLQVVFSRSGQSADEVILDHVRSHGNARALIVVSSDEADIGRVARELGARVEGAGAFLTRISRGRSQAQDGVTPDDEKPEEIDVDYWLRQFEKRRRDPKKPPDD